GCRQIWRTTREQRRWVTRPQLSKLPNSKHPKVKRGCATSEYTPHVAQTNARNQDRQTAQERNRRPHHAGRLWHIAKPPGGERMHFRLWQAAWYSAQGQAPWHCGVVSPLPT